MQDFNNDDFFKPSDNVEQMPQGFEDVLDDGNDIFGNPVKKQVIENNNIERNDSMSDVMFKIERSVSHNYNTAKFEISGIVGNPNDMNDYNMYKEWADIEAKKLYNTLKEDYPVESKFNKTTNQHGATQYQKPNYKPKQNNYNSNNNYNNKQTSNENTTTKSKRISKMGRILRK